MKKIEMMRLYFLFLILMMPQLVQAGPGTRTQQEEGLDLKPGISQPYLVKKGDTLWDVANHFFKDPMKWLKIWERNPHITNPDLIFPGNKIWFDGNNAPPGGLTTIHPRPAIKTGGNSITIHPEPAITVKSVERMDTAIDPSLLLTALTRQDFIQSKELEGVGYIVDSEDERLNYGGNDEVYLKLNKPVDRGDLFDVFRTASPIRDPESQNVAGFLVLHLGQVEITAQAGDLYKGRLTRSFEEISRGDRLKPARIINTRVIPVRPSGILNGKILYIRNDATEAGQHQIVGISLGIQDKMQAGSVLSVHRAGRRVHNVATNGGIQLPEEDIGELMVLVPQKTASIAIITKSTASIHIGDSVHGQTRK